MLETAPVKERAEAVLRKHWGHAAFRPGQWAAIAPLLEGRDVLAVLPTGGGKSVCYQVPALLGEGLTLVVSPLIALMQDQVAGLNARGVPAAFINSTLSAREIDQRWTDAEFGRYRLLYVAPERLQTEVFQARAERLKVGLLAVDEAHCVSEWGPHFRPSYLQIADARALLGSPPTLAVTATATPEVRRDVIEHLALRSPEVVVRGFDRPNVVWSIFRTDNKRAKVLDVLKGVSGCGILYTATRRGAEEWADWLNAQGVRAAAYHGGMAAPAREQVQQGWMDGKTRLIAATNAFGMGIDKADVRFVLHADLPASLEAYYQEAGRAGRDGQRSYAVLLYQPTDEATQRTLIEAGHPDGKAVREVYDAVCNLAQLPIASLPEAPLPFDDEAVARLTGYSSGKVRTAVELMERQGVWQVLPPRRHRGMLHFHQSAEAMRDYVGGLENKTLAAFVQALLRTVHADAFSDWWEIDLRLLQKRTGLARDRLLRGLAFLKERGLIDWRAPGTARLLLFAEARAQQLPVDGRAVQRARRRAEHRLDDLLRYARSVTCRRHFLLAYFGEDSPARCGACDVCLGRHRAVVITPEDEPLMRHILRQVEQEIPRARWFDTDKKAPPDRNLEGLIDWLIQEQYLRLDAPLNETFILTPKAHDLMQQWQPRTDG